MCGICGTVAFAGRTAEQEAADTAVAEKMIGRLAHRGPDERGTYRGDGAALGHARLAVIDLETGRQPLSNEDGSLWITFNGEVYNYLELRDALKRRGHRFRTASDTEVVVHGYEEYGTEFFSRIIGQWALALWDTQRRSLLLCRDRVGICPLYYTEIGNRVLFASEVKALFADPEVPREFDFRGLAEVFTFWTAVPPQTVFKGIRELSPGQWIRWEQGRRSEGSYWQLSFPPKSVDDEMTLDDCAGRLRHTLQEATTLRFTRSDVPVAAYLSGGIDSSVTVLLMRQCTASRLKTFSLRFADAEFDEGEYQELMTRQLGTDHQVVTVSARQIGTAFPRALWHAEKPLLRTAPVPMLLLSGAVREAGYKVVVTGEGSDEMLGGYDIYRQALVRSFLARGNGSEIRTEIVRLLYPWLKRNPAGAPAFARQFFSQSLQSDDPASSHRIRWNSASALMRLFDADVRRELQKQPVAEEFLQRMPAGSRDWHPLSQAQWIEINALLSGYLLSSQGDRMLMAHGVEGRFPFLDVRLIEQAQMMPPRYKIMGLDEKHVLKYAFRHELPAEIVRRSKQPYRAPDAGSFFAESIDWVEECLNEDTVRSSGLFDPGAVARLAEKCRRRRGYGMSNSDNMAITGILSTLLLQRRFLQGREQEPPALGDNGGETRVIGESAD